MLLVLSRWNSKIDGGAEVIARLSVFLCPTEAVPSLVADLMFTFGSDSLVPTFLDLLTTHNSETGVPLSVTYLSKLLHLCGQGGPGVAPSQDLLDLTTDIATRLLTRCGAVRGGAQ